MKYLLFLIVVGVTTATTIPPEEPFGKPLEACKNRNSFTYTHNVRHESNCHQFYKCLGGYGFVIDCPKIKGVPLVFNEESLVCDWEGVPCSGNGSGGDGSGGDGSGGDGSGDGSDNGSDNGAGDGTKTTTPKSSELPDCAKDPDRKKPHEDCHKFYQCVNGNPIVYKCPENMHFNPTVAECEIGECNNEN